VTPDCIPKEYGSIAGIQNVSQKKWARIGILTSGRAKKSDSMDGRLQKVYLKISRESDQCFSNIENIYRLVGVFYLKFGFVTNCHGG